MGGCPILSGERALPTPPLAVISTPPNASGKLPMSTTAPPDNLSERSQQFWRATVELWVVDDPAALALLELACIALDRGEQARELLDADGLTVTDRYGQTKAHPAANIEQAARLSVARLLRELRLLEPVSDDESRIGRLGRS